MLAYSNNTILPNLDRDEIRETYHELEDQLLDYDRQTSFDYEDAEMIQELRATLIELRKQADHKKIVLCARRDL